MTNIKKNMANKIKKLKDYWVMPTETEYLRDKTKYIAEYTRFKGGGFFTFRGYVNRPAEGEVMWNKLYPRGFDSWAVEQGGTFNAYGEHLLVAKINELIDIVNKKK